MIGILLGLEEDPSEEFTTFSDKLQGYFVTKAVSREMDQLTWWQTNQHNYHHLPKVTKSLFSIPAILTPHNVRLD